jgi:hypothetical protein
MNAALSQTAGSATAPLNAMSILCAARSAATAAVLAALPPRHLRNNKKMSWVGGFGLVINLPTSAFGTHFHILSGKFRNVYDDIDAGNSEDSY